MELKRYNSRTWTYGTQKHVTVLALESGWKAGDWLAVKEEATSEGFLLFVKRDWVNPKPEPGEKGLITFKEGGPTGGYWHYERLYPQEGA